VGHRLTTFVSMQSHEDMLVLTEPTESGKVTSVVDRTFPLSEAPGAIRYVQEGRAREGS
jgi:hypothetical protein